MSEAFLYADQIDLNCDDILKPIWFLEKPKLGCLPDKLAGGQLYSLLFYSDLSENYFKMSIEVSKNKTQL